MSKKKNKNFEFKIVIKDIRKEEYIIQSILPFGNQPELEIKGNISLIKWLIESLEFYTILSDTLEKEMEGKKVDKMIRKNE